MRTCKTCKYYDESYTCKFPDAYIGDPDCTQPCKCERYEEGSPAESMLDEETKFWRLLDRFHVLA